MESMLKVIYLFNNLDICLFMERVGEIKSYTYIKGMFSNRKLGRNYCFLKFKKHDRAALFLLPKNNHQVTNLCSI